VSLRTFAAINTEIANLCRDLHALPRPIDLEEVSRIRTRIAELVREPSAESDAGELGAQAMNLLADVHAVLVQAYGGDLNGSARGPLVSSFYLAQIRDRLLGHEPARPVHVCGECIDLRTRLVNIYHLTLTGTDAASVVRTVRAASSPGAPVLSGEHQASIAQLARELLEQAALVPPRERFEGMVRAGLIDADGTPTPAGGSDA
jgi:hypothetical protein